MEQDEGVAERVGRSQQEQASPVLGQRLQRVAEALVDAARQESIGQARDPGRRLDRRERPAELGQRQWVAPALGQEALEDLGVQAPDQHGVEERPGVGRCEAVDRQLADVLETVDRLAAGQEQADRLGAEPVRDEPQGAPGRAVEPLGVVDQAEQRLARGRLRQEAQDGEADEVAVLPGSRTEPEHRLQRLTLRLRQCGKVVEQRPAQLLEPGVREIGLALDAPRPNDAEPRRGISGAVQQRGLSHAAPAAQEQGGASATTYGGQQLLEGGELVLASDQRLLAGHLNLLGVEPNERTLPSRQRDRIAGSWRTARRRTGHCGVVLASTRPRGRPWRRLR